MARRCQLRFFRVVEGAGPAGGHDVGERLRGDIVSTLETPQGRAEIAAFVGLPSGASEEVLAGALRDAVESGRAHVFPVEPAGFGVGRVGTETLLCASAMDVERESRLEPTHAVVVELLGEDDRPIGGMACHVSLSSGRVFRGTTDAEGRMHVVVPDASPCKVCFPELDAEAWEYVSAHPL